LLYQRPIQIDASTVAESRWREGEWTGEPADLPITIGHWNLFVVQ
jgi:hypothetical protein